MDVTSNKKTFYETNINISPIWYSNLLHFFSLILSAMVTFMLFLTLLSTFCRLHLHLFFSDIIKFNVIFVVIKQNVWYTISPLFMCTYAQLCNFCITIAIYQRIEIIVNILCLEMAETERNATDGFHWIAKFRS